MSVNMFDLLRDEPVAVPKAAATTAPKTSAKPLVGGVKKGQEASKAQSGSVRTQATTPGPLPGELKKDTNRGPRHVRQPRKDQEGRIRGREHDRHSGTGRPVGENKRGGAGSHNWGSDKQAQVDSDAAQVAAEQDRKEERKDERKDEETTAVAAEPVEEGAKPETEEKEAAPKEPEVVSYDSFLAIEAKKEKALSALINPPLPEARKIQPAWYKPEPAASTAPKTAPAQASSSNATSSGATAKKRSVPLSSIFSEAPREDRRERRTYEGDNKERRQGGDRRQGGQHGGQGGQKRQGGGGKKSNNKVFDATANQDQFPALSK